MEIFIPSNVDLEQLLKNDPTMQRVNGFHVDKLAYILHVLNEIPAFNKDIISEDGFVPVNAELLRFWIGDCYHHLLKYLKRNGIIESDRHFIIGKKSTCYRLSSSYQGELKPYKVTNWILRKKASQKAKKATEKKLRLIKGSKYSKRIASQKPLPNLTKLTQPYKVVEKWYSTGKLKVDHALAHTYNSAMYVAKVNDKSKWDYVTTMGQIKYKHPYQQYASAFINIEKMKDQQYNCHNDSNVFRHHSTLTCIKKELRHALTYDGKEMVCIDIANSQPFLLTLLLNKEFWSENNTQILNRKDIPYFHYHLPIFYNIKDFNLFITLLESSETKDCQGFQTFIDCVTNGEFYQMFSDLLFELTGRRLTKQEIKPIVFTTLFTDNRFIGQAAAEPKRLFKSTFPVVYEAICLVKRKLSESLPIALQRLESFIIYQRVIPRITTERPDVPLFPIHDSIATIIEHKDYVLKVMEEEVEKATGFKPKLSLEYWQSSKLESIVGNPIAKAA